MPIDIDVQSFAELNNNVTDINNKVTSIQNMVLNAVPAGSNNKIAVRRSPVWSIEGEEAYNGQFQELGNISGEVVLELNTTTSRTAIIATITGYTFVTSFGADMLTSHVYTIFLKQNSTGNYAVRWPYGASVLNMVGPDPNQITAVYVVKLPNGKIFVKCEAFQNTVEIGSVLAEIEKPLILYPTQEDVVSRSFEWEKSEPSFYGTVLSSVSSDWEVAKDELFSELIFSSYNNLVEVFSLPVRVQWVGLLYFRTRYNGSIDGIPSSSLWSLTFSRFFGNTTEKDLPIFGKLSVVEITKVLDLAANVGVAVAGSNGGTFTISSDGSWTFDPDGDFDSLTDDDTATTSVAYHVSDGEAEDEGILTMTVNAAVATDPDWNSVVLLIQPEDGAVNGSTTIIDRSPSARTLTRYDDTQVSTALGDPTVLFDGSGDYITAVHDSVFNFNSTCTLEFIITPATTSKLQALLTKLVTGNYISGFQFIIRTDGSLGLNFYYGTGLYYQVNSPAGSIVAGNTYHIALTRSADNATRLHLNGVYIGQVTQTSTRPSANTWALVVAREPGNTSRDFSGHMRVRWTDGVARYGTNDNFTPPTKFQTA